MGRKPKPAEVRVKFFSARASGATLKQAAAAAGISRSAGHYWLAQSGGVRPRVTKPRSALRLSAEERETISRGLVQKRTFSSIAAELGRLATRLGCDPRYAQLWCRSAYAFELLEWDERGGYRLTPDMRTLLLDATDPLFIGGRMQFFAALYQDFHAFPDYLRTGGTWPRSEHDPWLLEALKNTTEPDSGVWTETVLPQAPATLARLEHGGRLLDIGAGAGSALIHYASRFPRAEIVGIEFDQPSFELAGQAVAAAGLTDRVEVRHGDANQLNDLDAYDLITMNVTLHETGGPDEYRNVLARVHRALKPAGTLLVAELPYPDSPEAYREQPAYRLLAGVQLHEALVGCGAITQAELPELLNAAGFTAVRVADQPMPTRFVMLADKPS